MPKNRKSTKRDLVPGPWSDWTASPDDPRGEYYRARQLIDGGWEYDFHPNPFDTPRDPDVGDLADDLAGVNISGLDDDEIDPDLVSSSEYTISPGRANKGKGREDPGDDYVEDAEGYTSDTPTERALDDNIDDPLLEEALRQSRRVGRGGQPSGSGKYAAEEPAYSVAEEEPPAEETGYMAGEPLYHEALDPRYRVQKSKNWVPGTVFKIYWSEPMGANGALSVSGKQVYQGDFGMSFYAGFRRFIIVATDEGHSTCVPVSTYGNQGCRKNGVKAIKHGVIYGYGSKPRKDVEPNLGFPPVRMKFTAEGEKLAAASRVNYSKLMTIEHNCKVFFIGYIHNKDFDIVSEAVESCWTGKKHFPAGYMDSY